MQILTFKLKVYLLYFLISTKKDLGGKKLGIDSE